VSERKKPNAYPAIGTQQERLLKGLLAGDKITPITSIVEYNVFIPAARCAELRALGWPIRKLQVPHPNQDKFRGHMLPAYFIDDHFRYWYATQPNDAHPAEYKGKEGRGKFAEMSLDQIATRMDDETEKRLNHNAKMALDKKSRLD
jgi:hypothetical protein